MKKRHSLSISIGIGLIAVGYMIYYLLQDNLLLFSISSVHDAICNKLEHYHVIIVGLLPIYVALMIFGAGILGIYLGTALQRWLGSFIQNK